MVLTAAVVRRPQTQQRWTALAQQQQLEGPAQAPAAAPAVPPTGAPAGGPGEASPGAEAPAVAPVYETLNEDDQIILDMQREHAARQSSPEPEPAPAAAPDPKPKKEKEPPPAPAGAAPPAATTAIVKYKSPEDAVTAIVAAIESGDTKRIAKALGKPEAFLDASNAKWVAFREQQNAVRERDKQLTQREHEFNSRIAEARAEFGSAIKAAKAYRDGDLKAFVTLVQELTGERYDDAQRKVIQGEIAVEPGIKRLQDEIAALKAERAKEREEAEAARKTTDQKAQYERAVEAVSQELSGHRVAKIKGYQREVLTRVRDSWDADEQSYTKSFEEAADEIIAERDAEAEALGYQRPAPALPAAPAAPALPAGSPSVPPRAHAADAQPPATPQWADPKAPDMDDDEIIESIKRDVRAGRLKP